MRGTSTFVVTSLLPVVVTAQTPSDTVKGPVLAPEVVVSATRDEAREFDLPLAIDRIESHRLREDKAQVDLSESLNRVPGIVVQNRHNYAQDLQVSSRGFGARAAFGVRGVRLIADGIPATMPDGQGQTATFSLGSAERIEVLRGPFAALYGNASGGLIQLFTQDAPARPSLRPSLSLGSYGSGRAALNVAGESGALNYVLDASRFRTDGYRAHSAARREQVNAKFGISLPGGGRLTAVANTLEQPDTQDPLGLTRDQFQVNPRQATADARVFDTRKSIAHRQAGLIYERPLDGGGRLRLAGYGGGREVMQFLAIPLAAQNLPRSAGGVVDLDRTFGGLSVRHTLARGGDAGEYKLTTGIEHDRMDERRRGYVNDNGVAGALKRDQDDTATSTDLFAIGEWSLTPRWVLAGGARASRVRFRSADRFVTADNPDDSGAVRYSGTSFALGLLYKPSDALRFYANAGRGFETPTLAELAYRAGGASGFNGALRPSRAAQVETGIKANLASGQLLRWAVFDITTRDEIVVNQASGGRTDFANAGRTRRQGMELSWEAAFEHGFEAYVAWTLIDARYRDRFSTAGTSIPSGKRLPGVAANTMYAELVWRHAAGWHAGIELRRVGSIPVNDLNSESADAYTVAAARIGAEQRGRGWRMQQFLRIDNLTDRRYAGSVIVNDNTNRRYYEPAPGRNFLLGLETSLDF